MKKAIYKGTTIQVYRSSLRIGKWINANDCATEYHEADLKFID